MNIRLDIASRVLLAGMLARPSSSILPDDELARSAMSLADALIAAEEETRKPTSENPAYDVTVAHDVLVNDLTLLREELNTMPTLPSKVVRSLDIILAKDKARRQ